MLFDFRKKYDIAVAGAGIAGIAAALAAARRGHSTVLIEKQMLIGGLATSGLIFIYLPLCDGNGTQVTFGISEELLKASIEFSPFDINEKWGGKIGGRTFRTCRYECDFSPAGMILSLDDLLRRAGVDLWLDTRVCAVQQAGDGKVTALEVENSSGRGVIEAGYFVDATGDATVIRRAGGRTETEPNHQALWLIQRAPGDDLPYYFTDSIHIQPFGSSAAGEWVKGDVRDARTATEFIRTGWQTARNYYRDSYRSGKTDHYHHYPLHFPAMPQIRKIARIHGRENLSDGSEWTRSESSVGLYADWRKPGKIYETPFGTLIPDDVRGVFAAGRCIAASGDAWESFRVIPAAAMTGEIAGVGAALAVETKCDGADLSAAQLRMELRKNNFKFHFEEVGLNPNQYKPQS